MGERLVVDFYPMAVKSPITDNVAAVGDAATVIDVRKTDLCPAAIVPAGKRPDKGYRQKAIREISVAPRSPEREQKLAPVSV